MFIHFSRFFTIIIYLGGHSGTSLNVQPADSYRVEHWRGNGPTNANCDGMWDLAVTDQTNGEVLVHLNEGWGTFSPEQSFASGQGPIFVGSGDLDLLGRDDLAIINGVDEDVTILLNKECEDVRVCGEEEDAAAVFVCIDEPVTLEAPEGFSLYRWNDGSSARTLTFNPSPGLTEMSASSTWR